MNIYELRNSVDTEIIDFNQLNSILHDYVHPRGKVSYWIKSGDLVRVKKGLYVFGRSAQREPYSMELLANLIYGPSAVSLDYALYYYGIIPELVNTITSITSKRNKGFHTPVGDFTYTYLHPSKFPVGLKLQMQPDNTNFLIATAEKALCDFVTLSAKNLAIKTIDELEAFLFDDLRIDEAGFNQLSIDIINQITKLYHNRRLNQFTKLLNLWVAKNA